MSGLEMRKFVQRPPTTELPFYGEAFDVISNHLHGRGSRRDDFDFNQTHGTEQYVVRMAQDLQVLLQAHGAEVSIDDILRREALASGHCDYHTKFALYLSEVLVQRAH